MDEYGRSEYCPTRSLLLAFVTGVAVGTVAALLFAPQPGRESREQVKGIARRASDTMREATEHAEETFHAAVQKGRKIIREQTSVVKEALEAGRKAMKAQSESGGREKTSGV